MRVFILVGHVQYEGEYIIGVYDSREKAEAAKNDGAKPAEYPGIWLDWYSIQEFSVA